MFSPARARKLSDDGEILPFVSHDALENVSSIRDSSGSCFFCDLSIQVMRPECFKNMDKGRQPFKWQGQKSKAIKTDFGFDIDTEWQFVVIEHWLKKSFLKALFLGRLKMFNTNFIKEKLHSGKPVLGTWSGIPSTVTTDIISSTGLDFIIIDSEHGPVNFETALDMVITCESRKVSPIIRVGGVIESEILKALDIGAHAVQVPNVTHASDLSNIIRFSKYPPIGNRGFSPFTRAGRYDLASAPEMSIKANENTLVIINIRYRCN